MIADPVDQTATVGAINPDAPQLFTCLLYTSNPDVSGPGEGGMVPATGAVAAMISAATGVQPYYIGKPNPLIMRTALRTIEAHSEDSDVYKRQDTWFSLVGVFCQLRWQKTPTKEKSTALPKANNAFCVSSTYILG